VLPLLAPGFRRVPTFRPSRLGGDFRGDPLPTRSVPLISETVPGEVTFVQDFKEVMRNIGKALVQRITGLLTTCVFTSLSSPDHFFFVFGAC